MLLIFPLVLFGTNCSEYLLCINWLTCTEHFKPLFEHIGKLEEALYNIQFEQHWLEAQTDRQAIGNWAAYYIHIETIFGQHLSIYIGLLVHFHNLSFFSTDMS